MNHTGGEVKIELVDTRVSSVEELIRRVISMGDFSTYRFRVEEVDFTFHWGGGGMAGDPAGLYYGPAENDLLYPGQRFKINPRLNAHMNIPGERQRMAEKAARLVFEMAPTIKTEEIVEG